MNENAKPTFESTENFYDFVDSLRVDLNKNGFSKVSQKLNFILHEMAYTTGSEFLGELKLVLLNLKEYESKQLTENLLKNVNICFTTIENAFDRAHGKN